MANWHISRINNATHEVELRSDEGDVIQTTVPEEHRDLPKHKAYLQSLCDAHMPDIKPEVPQSSARLYYAAAVIAALLLYILRLKLGH